MIDEKIKKGLEYIKEETEKDVFLGFETPFVSILIWQALEKIDQATAKKIIEKGVEKLINEKGTNGSFNYWLKNSQKYKTEPYPDDLDDTFCALQVINQHNPKLIKGADLAKIANLLVFCEEKEGGPYRTWLTNKNQSDWFEVDVAVNSNVLYFLETQGIYLKKIEKLIEKSILEKNFYSPHYGESQVIYFVSRVYKGKHSNELVEIVKEKLGKKNNPTETAILLKSMMNLGAEIDKKEIDKLLELQNRDGSWKEDYFYHYKKDLYVKNKALTTALAIETLNEYTQKRQIEKKKKERKPVVDLITDEIKKELQSANGEMQQKISLVLKKILKKENAEIILLSPFAVAETLKNRSKIDNDFLIRLGVINGLGWMAYTIYDDLIDEDKTLDWLPTANVICRKMDIMFTQLLPENKNFMRDYVEIMTELEEANLWELRCCRKDSKAIPSFENVKKLSGRSMGHALTSLAILYKSGAEEKDVMRLKNFFELFLAAKQMNDDAHDWETDLKKGQINSAGTEIFKLSKDKNDYDEMRLIFWEKVFDKYAKKTLDYCAQAKEKINEISCLKNTDSFDRMLNKVIKSTQMALDEKKEAIDFINSYYKK